MELINFLDKAVSSKEELRKIVGEAHEHIIKKSVSTLNEDCRKFISMSSMVFISTSNAEGKCDVSPRGDLGGCVRVLNDKQLLIPDRLGNKKQDSHLNILSNPNIGMVFIIPGVEEVLRVNGRATVIKDKELLSRLELNGNIPLVGIGVDVEECFVHCSRAIRESGIWNLETWPSKEEVPTALEIFLAHLKINGIDISKDK